MFGERLPHRHALFDFFLDALVGRDELRQQLHHVVESPLRNDDNALDGVRKDNVALRADTPESAAAACGAMDKAGRQLTGFTSMPCTSIGTSVAHGLASMPTPTVDVARLHTYPRITGQLSTRLRESEALAYRKLERAQLRQVAYPAPDDDAQRAPRLHPQRHDAAEHGALLPRRLAHDDDGVGGGGVDVVCVGRDVGGLVAAEVG